MAYVFRGLIAAEPAAHNAATGLDCLLVELGQGLLLLPGPRVDADEQVGDVEPLWWGLVERVGNAARAASEVGPIAYVEAEFFGGNGQQSAIVWDRRHPILGPVTQEFDGAAHPTPGSPINAALRCLGARADDGRDEFDSLLLGRYRHVEDWFPS